MMDFKFWLIKWDGTRELFGLAKVPSYEAALDKLREAVALIEDPDAYARIEIERVQ